MPPLQGQAALVIKDMLQSGTLAFHCPERLAEFGNLDQNKVPEIIISLPGQRKGGQRNSGPAVITDSMISSLPAISIRIDPCGCHLEQDFGEGTIPGGFDLDPVTLGADDGDIGKA